MSIENLLAKILSDEASKEEKAQLESWKLEGEDNLKALQEMTDIWGASEGLKDYQEFDSARSWKKLNSAIVTEELQQPVKKESFSIVRRLMPLAASLLLLIAAGVGVRSYLASESEITTFAANNDTQKEVFLADNTEILLDRNSSVEILSDFSEERVVSLSGRAYYNVESDVDRPFTIKTKHGNVTVVGTEFTLTTTEEKTELFLYEGRVNYNHKGKIINLKPSEAIVIEQDMPLKYRFNQQNAKSWISNKLVFNDVSVIEVFKTLQRHYGVKIQTMDKFVDESCTVSSIYEGVSLSEILKELSVFLSFEYTESSDGIVIKKLSC